MLYVLLSILICFMLVGHVKTPVGTVAFSKIIVSQLFGETF